MKTRLDGFGAPGYQIFDFKPFNSYCAIRYFREHLPAIFLRPQNITKHTLYVFRPSIPTHYTVFCTGIQRKCRVIN